MDAYGPRWPNFMQTNYDHWTTERLDNSNATTWVDSSPMDAYGREPLDTSFAQTGAKAKGDYPHWSWDRLNNAKEISYLTGSAMDAIAVDDLRKDLYL